MSEILQIKFDRIGGVMVSVVTSSAGNRGFEPRSDQTKDYNISMQITKNIPPKKNHTHHCNWMTGLINHTQKNI